MRMFSMWLAALLLSACQPGPADTVAVDPGQAPDAVPAATPAAVPEPAPASPIAMQSPSFDCAKAISGAEKQVCSDAELAALDRQLAAQYALNGKSTQDMSRLAAEQRGWTKGRDACWKDDNPRRCVLEAYRTRLVELKINAGDLRVPKTVEYACSNNRVPFSMVFYDEMDPRAALMTWGSDQAIVFPIPSASGVKYGRHGVEFWDYRGEASVDFFGEKLSCRPRG